MAKNKFKINKKSVGSLLACLGLGGAIIHGTVSAGPYVDSDTHMPGLYYVNTKNIHLSNEELLAKFQEEYNKSELLQEYWADIYPELCSFILNFGDKLDQEQLLDTLSNLEMKVVDKFKWDNLLAVYNYKSNNIAYAEKLFYKKDSEIKEIKLHESYHYLFHKNFYGSFFNFFRVGRQLDEGNASLLTREAGAYVGVDIYEKNTFYVKVICELIGADNYLEAMCGHDLLDLIDHLSEYCTKAEVISLLRNIDRACIYYDSKNTEYDRAAWDILFKIYEKKHGVSIEESNDEVMKAYCNKLLDTNYQITGAKASHHAHINKNYFINIETPSITFSDTNGEYGEVYLNEDNSVVDKSKTYVLH